MVLFAFIATFVLAYLLSAVGLAGFALSLVSLCQGVSCHVAEAKWLGLAGLLCVGVSWFSGDISLALSIAAFILSIVGCRAVGTAGMALSGDASI